MRPTPDKEKFKGTDNLVLDPEVNNKLLSETEAEIWLEFAGKAIQGLTSNHDLTANNVPTTITDEACLMADRMLLNYRRRLNHARNNKEK